MIRKCHGLEIELNTYVKNNSKYIHCYIRGRELLLTPEEEVRQATLKLIFEHLDIESNSFICRVEFQSLDISFYYKYPTQNFQPSLNPFLIIETKSDDCGSLLKPQFENQLLKYVERHKTPHALLANSKKIYYFNQISNYRATEIDLNEISCIFNNEKPELAEDISDFNNAQNGSVESFRRLATKFGKSSKITFICKEHPAPIKAYLFDFTNDYIFFYLSEVRGKVRKRPKIKTDSFRALISITE